MEPSTLTFMFSGANLILFGIAVLVASHLVVVRRDETRQDLLLLALTVVGWTLIATGTAAFMLGVCFLLGVPGPLLWMTMLVVIAATYVRRQQARKYALLWTLAVAAERFLPLGPAIAAFAKEHRGGLARRIRRLAELVDGGTPLPDALQKCRGLISAEVLPAIRVGYESGALATALRHEATVRNAQAPIWEALAGKLVYLCVLPPFALGVVSFLMLKIVPSYVKIFDDFDAELPAISQSLISVCVFISSYWWLLMPLFFGVGLLTFYVIVRYIGWTHTDLPGIDRLVRRLHTARILDALSLAARRERPLGGAVADLARSYHVAWIRRRLHAVCRDLDAGRDWCESLHRRGLIRQADRAILQAAQRMGNLPWALREMADSNRRRLAYRLHALIQLLIPPIILFYGAAVMFVVVALFLPLITLVQRLV